MRVLALLSVGAALVGAFFLGRLSEPAGAVAAGKTIRIPAVATRCVVSEEGGAPDMLCNHTPRGRYEVVIFPNRLFVYRNGDPDHPRFSVRWRP